MIVSLMPMKYDIIAVGNLKGGTGKTTIAVNLACALNAYLVDADAGQNSAAVWLEKGNLPIKGESLPLGSSLEAWVRQVAGIKHRPLVLDLPPALGEVTTAALFIADLFLVPITPSGIDLQATIPTLEMLRRVRERRRERDGSPHCVLVPSKVDARTANGRDLPAVLKGFRKMVGPEISQRVAFVDSFSEGQWVGDYAPGSQAHQEIMTLARRARK